MGGCGLRRLGQGCDRSDRLPNRQDPLGATNLAPKDRAAGVLTTDSGLTFTGDAMGNFLALDSGDGKDSLARGSGSHIQSSPITYELDGRQYLLTCSGGVLFAWALPREQ